MQAEPAAVEPVETPEALMEVMEGMQPPHPSAMILMYLMRKLGSRLHEVEMEELGLMVRTRANMDHLDLEAVEAAEVAELHLPPSTQAQVQRARSLGLQMNDTLYNLM